MGQQPNIELDLADRPRREPVPEPARPWKPNRPGVITHPDDKPNGPGFGHPGPDTGWALTLLRRVEIPHGGKRLEKVLAALMAARAARYGRAPVPEDREVAFALAGIGDNLPAHLSERRERWVEAAAHEKSAGASALADIEPDLLVKSPSEVRDALAS